MAYTLISHAYADKKVIPAYYFNKKVMQMTRSVWAAVEEQSWRLKTLGPSFYRSGTADLCVALAPNKKNLCTRDKGHAGFHVATQAHDNKGNVPVIDVWRR